MPMPRDVLFVEDNLMIVIDVEHCLQDLGVDKVRIAANVPEAMSAIAERRPDFAILDYSLEGETSEPVAMKLRELGVNFIFATGHDELTDKLVELGAIGVILKPYMSADLRRALAAVPEPAN